MITKSMSAKEQMEVVFAEDIRFERVGEIYEVQTLTPLARKFLVSLCYNDGPPSVGIFYRGKWLVDPEDVDFLDDEAMAFGLCVGRIDEDAELEDS